MTTPKLKVGDKIYAYPLLSYLPRKTWELREYEVIRAGRKYYTVQRGVSEYQVTIETLKEKAAEYVIKNLWFISPDEYKQWQCREEIIRSIKPAIENIDYRDWLDEDLEQLHGLLKKYS